MKTKTIILTILIILTIIIILSLTYYLALPQGRILKGEVHQISEENIEFLYDLTYKDEKGNTIYNHEIFDKTFDIIDNAENFIIINMFLFGTTDKPYYRNLTQELTDTLINKKQSSPETEIYFITDDYNFIDKPHNQIFLDSLTKNNINIIFTPLTNNKDSNLITKIFRNFLKSKKKILNHRKFIIADINNQIITLLTSGNPHDLSSANSNTGLIIKEKIHKDIYEIENQDAEINNQRIETILNTIPSLETNQTPSSQQITIQYLADGALMQELKNQIDKTTSQDKINIAMFYLSDKTIINALTQASKRNTEINIILDTNDFFFNQKKFGIPNKPVAEKLLKDSDNKINIKWYKSHGEQFHTKLVIIKSPTKSTVLTGSTNLADNNIRFYNLQSDIKLTANNNSTIIKDISNYFNMMWNNTNGIYTVNYEEEKSSALSKKLRYELEQFLRVFQ